MREASSPLCRFPGLQADDLFILLFAVSSAVPCAVGMLSSAARPQTSSGSAALNGMKPNGLSKAAFLAAWLGAALGASALAGLLTATAGGWLYAPVYNVTAPLACAGDLVVESRGHSPRIDSYRAKLNILCRDEATGRRTDVTSRVVLLAFLIYSALAFAALTPVLIILARRLNPGGTLDALLPDPTPHGSRPRNVYNGRGRSS